MPPLGEVVETKTKHPGSSGGGGRNDDHEGVSACTFPKFIAEKYQSYLPIFSFYSSYQNGFLLSAQLMRMITVLVLWRCRK